MQRLLIDNILLFQLSDIAKKRKKTRGQPEKSCELITDPEQSDTNVYPTKNKKSTLEVVKEKFDVDDLFDKILVAGTSEYFYVPKSEAFDGKSEPNLDTIHSLEEVLELFSK